MATQLKHGSLFSGIGGFDLAAEWMGWENIFHCENNDFSKKILKYYWPHAESHDNIITTDFTIYRGSIDLITGGFPCQPYSFAGKRKGTKDERHLWPEMLRAIREIRPRWVVGENVYGLVNWDGGLVFDQVQTDLENQGYQVWPYVLPACGIDAPHRRERIWFVAYADSEPRTISEQQRHQGEKGTNTCRENESRPFTNPDSRIRRALRRYEAYRRKIESENNEYSNVSGSRHATNPDSRRFQRLKEKTTKKITVNRSGWSKFPTQSPICNGDDGLSSGLDKITFSKWRNESIKAGGNAIVPGIALQIFKAIYQYEQGRK